MANQASTHSLDETEFSVQRGIHAASIPRPPIADLTGKGVFDSVSSNRSKMNDQNS